MARSKPCGNGSNSTSQSSRGHVQSNVQILRSLNSDSKLYLLELKERIETGVRVSTRPDAGLQRIVSHAVCALTPVNPMFLGMSRHNGRLS
ncbi:Mitochondrial Rho GTPase 1 [Clarias magur]|uniref:Mitochondrial Rho GTPase 1 n=1 Tax=Clarias magur TaxID=1594786 RepID=A0A8J4X8U6_CLAMG|nr:Mitochondrial Rho GTPase 1 [Clarias magur]